MHMTDSGGKLRYVVQLTGLARRMTIGSGVECKCERFVIREDMKMSTFEEMTDGEIYSQQFPVEGTVSCLSRCHLPGEERDGMPGTIDVLL